MTTIVALAFFDGSTTEAEALQAAFDAASAATHPVVLDWREGPGDGVWQIDETVEVHLDEATVYPGQIVATDTAVALRIDSRLASWVGQVRVTGAGSTVYSQRSVETLVELGDVWTSRFDGFVLSRARRDCLAVSETPGATVIGADLGTILARDCGSSAIAGHHSSVRVEWSGAVQDYLGAHAPWQHSRIPVVPHPDWRLHDPVYIEDRIYWIHDMGPDYVDVYPHYRGTAASGTIESSHGAGVRLRGGNTTGVRGRLVCQRTGVCLLDGGLYGGTWEVVASANGVGIQWGEWHTNVHIRGVYTAHLENPANRLGGVKVTRRALEGAVIYGLLRDPMGDGARTRWDGGASRWGSLDGLTFVWGGEAIDGAAVSYRP